jgi:hypothetical protein
MYCLYFQLDVIPLSVISFLFNIAIFCVFETIDRPSLIKGGKSLYLLFVPYPNEDLGIHTVGDEKK